MVGFVGNGSIVSQLKDRMTGLDKACVSGVVGCPVLVLLAVVVVVTIVVSSVDVVGVIEFQ
jgi:hypothetical protein